MILKSHRLIRSCLPSLFVLALNVFHPVAAQENSSSATNSAEVAPQPVNATNSPASTPMAIHAASTGSAGLSGTNAAPSEPTKAAAEGTEPTALQSSAIILGYHQFTPAGQYSKNIYSMDAGTFEDEMKQLQDSGCHVVPLSDVVAFVEGKGSLPPHAVAITIDDGYKSPILYAAPILKKYGYPWTFFCYTDFITSHESKGASSWDDLKELQAEGVDVECHSKSHPFLSRKLGKSPEDYDKWLTAETAGAKATLEQHLNKTIKYFAYPYGDYNKQVEDKLIASGYEAIFTVAANPVHASTSPYRMGRYVITSPEEKDFAAYLRQGALSIMAATPAPGATISDPHPVILAVLNYVGHLDPKSIEATVKGFGPVPADYDDKTSTVRLHLQRDLIQPVVNVTIRVKDADAKQTLVTNWQFNYEPVDDTAPVETPGTKTVVPDTTPAKAKT